MANKKISELDQTLNLSDQADFPLSQDNGGEPTTFKAKLTQIATKIAEAITFSNLITNDKHIIGAINEIAQGGGGTTDYDDLENKPQINSVELSGNKSLDDLGIQPSEISKSASGSIATFTDGGDNIPVKSFECEIVAQQASGTPTPVNPLAITGFSQADISVCGKNLCNWKVNTTSSPLIISLPKGTYTISSDGQSTFGYWYFRFTDIDGNVISDNPSQFGLSSYAYSSSSQYFYGGNNRTDVTFILPDNGYTVQIGTLNGDGTISAMLAQGSTAIAYEPYKGNTYIVSFGQTIYGGRLIYSNGAWAIEATHEILTLYGTERISLTGAGTGRRFRFDDTFTYNAMPLSSHFIESTGNSNPWGYYRLVSGYLLLTDNNSQMADETALKTWLANQYSGGTPVQLLCELATPVIIPITSSTRVKTISGANNIFSNTGDVELEYFTDKADEIASLIREEQASNSKVKKYQATLSSSQYGWFTFVDENGNALSPSKAIPIHATCISGSNYWKGHFVERTNDYLFKVTDINNSNASNYAPIGTAMSNLVFDMAYIEL